MKMRLEDLLCKPNIVRQIKVEIIIKLEEKREEHVQNLKEELALDDKMNANLMTVATDVHRKE